MPVDRSAAEFVPPWCNNAIKEARDSGDGLWIESSTGQIKMSCLRPGLCNLNVEAASFVFQFENPFE